MATQITIKSATTTATKEKKFKIKNAKKKQ